MCGRYHIDEETAKEIEKIIQLTEKNVIKRASINFQMQARDHNFEFGELSNDYEFSN